MEQYQVTGMSCAACSARVEKAVSRVPGVTSCAVSLLTKKPEKALIEQVFACYDKTVVVTVKDSIGDQE